MIADCKCFHNASYLTFSDPSPSKEVMSVEDEKISVITVLVLGAPNVGKTHLIHLLLNMLPPNQDFCTEPVHGISYKLVCCKTQDPPYTLFEVNSENNDVFNDKNSNLKFIKFIECGDQLKSHDILPFFIPKPTIIIFVLNQTNNLPHRAKGKQEEIFLSDEQIIQHCLGTFFSQDSSPMIIIVRMHHGNEIPCISETCKEQNQIIDELLGPIMNRILCCEEDKIIFDVNCQDVDRELAKRITDEIIQTACSPEVKCLLKLEIMLLRLHGGKFLSFDECHVCANWLEKDVLIDCLKHSNVLFLHSNTVFCNSQVILTKVTELVQYCHLLRNKNGVRQMDFQFRDKGMLSMSQLKKGEFQNLYKNGLFTVQDLVNVLVKRCAIKPIDNDVYFMPALLNSSQEFPSQSNTCASLMINFQNGYVPNALFSSLVAKILSKDNPTPWNMCMNHRANKPLCLYRNKIKLFQKKDNTIIVTLVDMFSYIKVLVEENSLKYCEEIRQDVHTGIKLVCSDVEFGDAFMCEGISCKKYPPHLALVVVHVDTPVIHRWKCTIIDDEVGDLNKEKQERWFGSERPNKTGE